MPRQSDTTPPGPDSRKAGHLRVVPKSPLVQKQGKKTRSAPDPYTGLTEKQEAFCQGVHSGLSLTDAYRAAYDTSGMTDKTCHEKASRMLTEGKVRTRLMALSDQATSDRRMLAASDAALALATLRKLAQKADTDASQIRAAELLAKAAGVFTEQVEITDKSSLTEEELERAIADRLRKLGLAG